MKLTVLGKHGPWPKAGCACSGYLLEAGGRHILLDCGCGVLGRLQCHCPIERLDGIVLSHLHSDHMGDMLVLRYALPIIKKDKLPVFLPAEPSDIAGVILSDKSFDCRTVAAGDFVSFIGLKIAFFPVRHPVPCNAVKIEHEGKTLVFSGDMNTTPGFEEFAKGADLLLIDGCFLKKDWNEGLPHLSAALAADIGLRAGAGKLLLTHMRPVDDEAALLQEARRVNPAAEAAQMDASYEV